MENTENFNFHLHGELWRLPQEEAHVVMISDIEWHASPAQGTVRTMRIGELIHSDLCGPMPTEGIGKQGYICICR